jgi:hypothetical protein
MQNENTLLKQEINKLIERKSESKNIDYKQGINWYKCTKDEKLGIIKDILAMANTQDGGWIIFGVREPDRVFEGIKGDEYNSFDETSLNRYLHKYAEPKFAVQVYRFEIDNKLVVALNIPEFEENPIICKTDAHSSIDRSKHILKKGAIYIRTEEASSEIISSSQEMSELLGRGMTKKGDKLLHFIERLIKGKPLKASVRDKEKFEEEIKEAEAFFSQNIGDELQKYGYWEVFAYPKEYNSNGVIDRRQIKELIKKSEVRLLGWYFPHTDKDNKTNFNKGIQSYTSDVEDIEGYRAYQSGLFVWKKVLREDIERHDSNAKPILSFIRAIWSITEFILFFKRYYVEIIPESDLHFRICLNGAMDRKLASFKPGVHLNGHYISKAEAVLIEKDVKVVELASSYKEIANSVVREIFWMFNWSDPSETMIDGWQTELIEKKY